MWIPQLLPDGSLDSRPRSLACPHDDPRLVDAIGTAFGLGLFSDMLALSVPVRLCYPLSRFRLADQSPAACTPSSRLSFAASARLGLLLAGIEVSICC